MVMILHVVASDTSCHLSLFVWLVLVQGTRRVKCRLKLIVVTCTTTNQGGIFAPKEVRKFRKETTEERSSIVVQFVTNGLQRSNI